MPFPASALQLLHVPDGRPLLLQLHAVQAVPNAGWFAYTPLSTALLARAEPRLLGARTQRGRGRRHRRRHRDRHQHPQVPRPRHDARRMPLFAWAMLVTAFMIIFAFTTLVVGSLLLELSRSFNFRFFDPEAGGSSLLWQHLFWIFGHPEVYIQFLPAAGVVSMIVPVLRAPQDRRLRLARRRVRRHRLHVVRPVGAPHVHRRPAAGRAQLLLRRQHRHRRAGRHPDLLLARHDGLGPAGVEDARCCSSSASSSRSSSAASPG